MPNITRGDRMAGLVSYLAGPGRANEHESPHLVAGDPAMTAWYADTEIDHDAAIALARHLERPRTALDVDVPGGHVWHCSLSIRVEEGRLSDETWRQIADDFVTAMGFDDNEGTKAPCRWIAMHHGDSKTGNDHIHIAVNLVREDGTKASIHHDFRRAQSAVRALEVRYGLETLESVRAERATRGFSPAEQRRVQAQAARAAQRKYETRSAESATPMPAWDSLPARDRHQHIAAEVQLQVPRQELARTVRACSAASVDEAEFVRRMRRAGVLVRPRYADGRTDVITGYSVAARPAPGERPAWYGGGSLGRDLTLPRLRDGWPDSPEGAGAAAAEWNAAGRGRRVVAPGRETVEPDPRMWAQCTRELGELRERLSAVPVEDRDTWATVARQTAGAFAAWSNQLEDEPGDLAAAADALAKSAQTFRRTETPKQAGTLALGSAAMLLASATHGGKGAVAQAALLRELVRFGQSVHAAALAAQQTRQAQLIETSLRDRLSVVHANLVRVGEHQVPAAPVVVSEPPKPVLDPTAQAMLERMEAGHAQRATEAASPVPNTIEQAKRQEKSSQGTDRDRGGAER
ncbi:relaxase/mobilization nuclease domain-containing protein [Agromyces neolithicus]